MPVQRCAHGDCVTSPMSAAARHGATAASQRGTRADAGKLQHQVQEVQQVTGLVDLHSGRLAEGNLPVEALHNGQHGKVSVLQVAETPEGQGGRACQGCNHDAAGSHLNKGTIGTWTPNEKGLGIGASKRHVLRG